jgi:hypothetical protein
MYSPCVLLVKYNYLDNIGGKCFIQGTSGMRGHCMGIPIDTHLLPRLSR